MKLLVPVTSNERTFQLFNLEIQRSRYPFHRRGWMFRVITYSLSNSYTVNWSIPRE